MLLPKDLLQDLESGDRTKEHLKREETAIEKRARMNNLWPQGGVIQQTQPPLISYLQQAAVANSSYQGLQNLGNAMGAHQQIGMARLQSHSGGINQ